MEFRPRVSDDIRMDSAQISFSLVKVLFAALFQKKIFGDGFFVHIKVVRMSSGHRSSRLCRSTDYIMWLISGSKNRFRGCPNSFSFIAINSDFWQVISKFSWNTLVDLFSSWILLFNPILYQVLWALEISREWLWTTPNLLMESLWRRQRYVSVWSRLGSHIGGVLEECRLCWGWKYYISSPNPFDTQSATHSFAGWDCAEAPDTRRCSFSSGT